MSMSCLSCSAMYSAISNVHRCYVLYNITAFALEGKYHLHRPPHRKYLHQKNFRWFLKIYRFMLIKNFAKSRVYFKAVTNTDQNGHARSF